MNNSTMGFDSSPATISSNKSPEAEVTEPPTGTILILYRKDMENFNKLVPIDGENGKKEQ